MRLTILIATLLLAGCTANDRAKNFGGTLYVDLPAGESLKFATWKETSLWYATEKRDAGALPKQTTMREDSTYGVMQGTVVFREH